MSIRHRYLTSLLATDLAAHDREGERAREGYPLWHRYLASLFDVPLRPRTGDPQAAMSESAGQAAPGRSAVPWRRLLIPVSMIFGAAVTVVCAVFATVFIWTWLFITPHGC